jgi:hypothetical protein
MHLKSSFVWQGIPAGTILVLHLYGHDQYMQDVQVADMPSASLALADPAQAAFVDAGDTSIAAYRCQ